MSSQSFSFLFLQCICPTSVLKYFPVLFLCLNVVLKKILLSGGTWHWAGGMFGMCQFWPGAVLLWRCPGLEHPSEFMAAAPLPNQHITEGAALKTAQVALGTTPEQRSCNCSPWNAPTASNQLVWAAVAQQRERDQTLPKILGEYLGIPTSIILVSHPTLQQCRLKIFMCLSNLWGLPVYFLTMACSKQNLWV